MSWNKTEPALRDQLVAAIAKVEAELQDRVARARVISLSRRPSWSSAAEQRWRQLTAQLEDELAQLRQALADLDSGRA